MNSNWSYSPETVTLGCDLCDLDLWPWPFAWTLPWSLVITPEHFMMIQWWEHSQKGVTDGRTDGQTDRKYHSWSCLVAAKNQKKKKRKKKKMNVKSWFNWIFGFTRSEEICKAKSLNPSSDCTVWEYLYREMEEPGTNRAICSNFSHQIKQVFSNRWNTHGMQTGAIVIENAHVMSTCM